MQELIERVNRARKAAQKLDCFQRSAEEHAIAIEQLENSESKKPVVRRKSRKKPKTFAVRYSEYYQDNQTRY